MPSDSVGSSTALLLKGDLLAKRQSLMFLAAYTNLKHDMLMRLVPWSNFFFGGEVFQQQGEQ